jgi:trk system potassium uptake protein TrkA
MIRTIIIGQRPSVYFLARQFLQKGHHTTIIHPEQEGGSLLAQKLGATVLIGDGSEPEVLEQAGIRRADIVVALMTHDEDNLIACQIARQVFHVPRTIALINDPENEALFEQLGVDVAVSAAQMIAKMIETEASFSEIMNQWAMAEGRVEIIEVAIKADSPSVGKTLSDLKLPSGSLIGSIIRSEQVFIPNGTSSLQANDRILLICQPDNHEQVLTQLGCER